MLINKLSKSLILYSSIGLIPFSLTSVTSCGCNKKSYVINYGDNVNCLDSNATNYKALADVQNSIRSKALIEPKAEIPKEEIKKNTLDASSLYFEIIASLAIAQNWNFSISDWKHDDSQYWNEFNFKFSSDLKKDLTIDKCEYALDEERKNVNLSFHASSEVIIVKSYMYMNVIVK